LSAPAHQEAVGCERFKPMLSGEFPDTPVLISALLIRLFPKPPFADLWPTMIAKNQRIRCTNTRLFRGSSGKKPVRPTSKTGQGWAALVKRL
jgi:hypothetical protein